MEWVVWISTPPKGPVVVSDMVVTKVYVGDKWTRAYDDFVIPAGSVVEVLRNFPRRRVLVEFDGAPVLTFQWCLRWPA